MSDVRELLRFERSLAGRRILVTGHTGFKGSWLTLWLKEIGAEVHGLSLEPWTTPNLFTEAHVGEACRSHIGDVRDLATVKEVMAQSRPEVVFHLAAQPLVGRSCEDPVETISTNVLGTAHILEAARCQRGVNAVLCITSDKVYLDQDWHWGYRESDPLGGKDPYSASKAAAEIIASSYRQTFAKSGTGLAIATARGGNIIGGGDWSANRIVPDFVRSVTNDKPLTLRHPNATRPWQHVLCLVHGYLVLAARLIEDPTAAATAWNLGPLSTDARTVKELVDGLSAAWKSPEVIYGQGTFPETRFLHLESSRARASLGWSPPFGFDAAVRSTADWYRSYAEHPGKARAHCERQISSYRAQLKGRHSQ